jgi:hypothetical protein
MLKRILVLSALVPALGVLLPSSAAAHTITGRITAYSTGSVSVFDHEVVTVRLDGYTSYSKLITQRPLQQDTRLTANALTVGRLVVVHLNKSRDRAKWVEIATDPGLGHAFAYQH